MKEKGGGLDEHEILYIQDLPGFNVVSIRGFFFFVCCIVFFFFLFISFTLIVFFSYSSWLGFSFFEEVLCISCSNVC